MRTLSRQLRPLSTAGNRIVDAGTLALVLLRGVNRSGLEYSAPIAPGSLARAGLSESDFDEMVTRWGANIIRLPLNQNWALARPGYDPEPYWCALDFAIEHAAARGAYTLLDLHWLDAVHPVSTSQDGTPNFVPPLPNPDSIELWRQLARRYAGEPAVLFDILNEPHDTSPAEWHAWATRLTAAVREEHPAALIFVSGLDWGYDLSASPIPGLQNVVYSTHVYPNKGNDWDRAFGNLSARFPVFVGEWGGRETDLRWGRKLLRYMDERNLGWTAWSWSDEPRLIQKGTYEPTAFGALVKEALPSAFNTD